MVAFRDGMKVVSGAIEVLGRGADDDTAPLTERLQEITTLTIDTALVFAEPFDFQKIGELIVKLNSPDAVTVIKQRILDTSSDDAFKSNIAEAAFVTAAYEPTPSTMPSQTNLELSEPDRKKDQGLSSGAIAGAVIGAVAGSCLCIALGLFLFRSYSGARPSGRVNEV